MCPDLLAKTFHLFSNTVPLVSYSVLIVIEKVKASTGIWCLPAELVVSPLISAQPDLCRVSFDCISVWAARSTRLVVYRSIKVITEIEEFNSIVIKSLLISWILAIRAHCYSNYVSLLASTMEKNHIDLHVLKKTPFIQRAGAGEECRISH